MSSFDMDAIKRQQNQDRARQQAINSYQQQKQQEKEEACQYLRQALKEFPELAKKMQTKTFTLEDFENRFVFFTKTVYRQVWHVSGSWMTEETLFVDEHSVFYLVKKRDLWKRTASFSQGGTSNVSLETAVDHVVRNVEAWYKCVAKNPRKADFIKDVHYGVNKLAVQKYLEDTLLRYTD